MLRRSFEHGVGRHGRLREVDQRAVRVDDLVYNCADSIGEYLATRQPYVCSLWASEAQLSCIWPLQTFIWIFKSYNHTLCG